MNTENKYLYDDDLENFNLVMVKPKDTNKDSNYSGSNAHSCNVSEYNPHDPSDHKIPIDYNIENDENLIIKKVLIVISLIILCATVTIPFIYCISTNNSMQIHNYFRTKTVHFQVSFEIFYSIWLIIIVFLIVSIIRNLFVFSDDIHEIKEIEMIISKKLGHYFYIGNTFIIITLCLWTFTFLERYGIVSLFVVLSSVFYYLVYQRLKSTIHKGILNKLGFEITVSFLLAWSNCLVLISGFMCIEFNTGNSNFIEFISFTSHCILFSLAILALTLYKDIFYGIIIFLFQIGIILSNKHKYSTNNKFTLVFAFLTGISLLFSICCIKNSKEEIEEHDIHRKYEEQKELKF